MMLVVSGQLYVVGSQMRIIDAIELNGEGF
jgi:hypothetical protein